MDISSSPRGLLMVELRRLQHRDKTQINSTTPWRFELTIEGVDFADSEQMLEFVPKDGAKGKPFQLEILPTDLELDVLHRITPLDYKGRSSNAVVIRHSITEIFQILESNCEEAGDYKSGEKVIFLDKHFGDFKCRIALAYVQAPGPNFLPGKMSLCKGNLPAGFAKAHYSTSDLRDVVVCLPFKSLTYDGFNDIDIEIEKPDRTNQWYTAQIWQELSLQAEAYLKGEIIKINIGDESGNTTLYLEKSKNNECA